MTVLATIVVLGVLIFVHELGHFWAAKAVGIEVQRFSIGLGPRLFGFTRGETEYIIAAIPLGGYVKMGGMDDEVMEQIEGGAVDAPRREPSDRDFDAKPIWARTLVISAGVIMNMVFAFGVYTFLAFQYGIQEPSTTRIGMIEASELPAGTEEMASVEIGSRFLNIGGEQVEDWGDVQQGLFRAEPGPLSVDLGEPRRTIELTIPASEDDRRRLVTAIQLWREAGVGFTDPGSPAARGGIEAGDRIVAVDGEPTENWWTFVQVIEARPGERVDLTVDRDGSELIRSVTLDVTEEEQPDGSVLEIGRVGIGPAGVEMSYTPVSLGAAIQTGYDETVFVTGLILGFLRDLVTLNISPRSVGSIVTIGEASGQAAAAGLDTFLRFMALFSVNLAVLNMLPIPVLDGGHLLFIAIEAIRGGRPLSVEQRLRWSNVGFLVIVGIMVWALGNDFLRLLGL
ncbi:MAG: RIP metalloprotease RseP [Gemmatimonadota bacterium]